MNKRKILSILAFLLAFILVTMSTVPIYRGGANVQLEYVWRDLKDGYPFFVFYIIFMVAAFVLAIISFFTKKRAKLFITLSIAVTWFTGTAMAIETIFWTEFGIIPLICYAVLCAPVLIWNLILKNEETAPTKSSLADDNPRASADAKPLSMLKATARYNMPGLIGEICGPITGFDSLRVKRISKIKGKLVIWEAKCPDLTLEDGDIGAAKVWGLNFPAKLGSDNITYCSYIDVVIKGQTNRIQIPVAKISGFSGNFISVNASIKNGQFPFKTLPQPTAGAVPVVSGWVKDTSHPLDRDEHFGDPVCPEGYHALIKGYFEVQPLYGSSKCRELGLPPDLLVPPEYIMEKQIKFDSIPSTLSTPVSFSESEAAVEVTKEITKTVSAPKIIIGRREFKKSEIEQMFAYFWVNGYNSLGFVEATEKIIGYFTDNGYIDEKTITKTDITNLLSFVWVSTYNTLPYNEATEKIVEHLTETI